jgi:hypothetical protein
VAIEKTVTVSRNARLNNRRNLDEKIKIIEMDEKIKFLTQLEANVI